jgi:hypothetical protein
MPRHAKYLGSKFYLADADVHKLDPASGRPDECV